MSTVNAPAEASPVAPSTTQKPAKGRGSKKAPAADPKTVKIKVESIGPTEILPTTRYWVGTMPDCPVQNVTVGGVAFPRFSGNPTFNAKGQPDRPLQMGAELDLTEAQVERIKTGVELRLLRLVGHKPKPGERDKRRGVLLVRDGPLRLEPGDQPLGRWLYMREGRRGAPDELPDTMVDR